MKSDKTTGRVCEHCGTGTLAKDTAGATFCLTCNKIQGSFEEEIERNERKCS
jgi:uncharacterized Zn finger protein (UPF0148 family)